ncbi:hypothetical protein Dimus_029047, partial [Dionaea muscipula]
PACSPLKQQQPPTNKLPSCSQQHLSMQPSQQHLAVAIKQQVRSVKWFDKKQRVHPARQR